MRFTALKGQAAWSAFLSGRWKTRSGRLDYAVSRVAGLPVTVFAQKEKAYLEASARLIRARPAFDAQSLTLARLSARLEAALQNQVPEKRLALTALTRRLADSLPDVTLMRTELAGARGPFKAPHCRRNGT